MEHCALECKRVGTPGSRGYPCRLRNVLDCAVLQTTTTGERVKHEWQLQLLLVNKLAQRWNVFGAKRHLLMMCVTLGMFVVVLSGEYEGVWCSCVKIWTASIHVGVFEYGVLS